MPRLRLLVCLALVAPQFQLDEHEPLTLMNENIKIIASIDNLNNPPVQKEVEVIKTLPCGEKMVSSKTGPRDFTIRSTFNGQKLAAVALCLLDGLREDVATFEKSNEGDPSKLATIRTIELTFYADPNSGYHRLLDIYCSNEGKFYTDLLGSVRECRKSW